MKKLITSLYALLKKNKLVSMILTILSIFGGCSILAHYDTQSTTITDSPISDSYIITGHDNIINNYYNNLTPSAEEICTRALEFGCASAKLNDSLDCKNELSFVNGKIGEGVLIDDCDLIVSSKESSPFYLSSGTIQLWVKFNDGVLDRPRYLFDFFNEYQPTRISLYLESGGFLTFSISDVDYSVVKIKDQLTKEELSDWIKLDVSWNSETGKLRLFINGLLRRERSIDKFNFTEPFKGLFIGSTALGKYQINGIIDEFRISDKVLSDGWIKADYLIVQNNSQFVTFGKEVKLNG